jgi:uncharacterized protein YaaQ
LRLIIAIVKGSDASGLLDALAEQHIGATRLAATGGFMSEGRTTFLIGVEDTREDEAIDIIRKCCSKRKRAAPQFRPAGELVPSVAVPVEYEAGGAIIFVTDVEDMMRL